MASGSLTGQFWGVVSRHHISEEWAQFDPLPVFACLGWLEGMGLCLVYGRIRVYKDSRSGAKDPRFGL